MWNLDLTYNFEASNTITIGNNTQPWGSAKHQATGDFIINSGTTVNMEAGQSIKLKSGFKLNDGAKLKISIDTNDPTLKSTKAEHLNAPTIMGSKFAASGDQYQVQSEIEHETISWLLIGNNYNFQSQSRTFYMPDNIPNGQFTLVFTGKRNGKTISSSKIVVVRNNKKTYRTGRVLDEKICLIYPNPTNSSIFLNLDKSISEFCMNIKDVSGKNVLSKSGLNNTEIKIDLSHLHRGFYFAEVFGDGNRLKTIKLIKH